MRGRIRCIQHSKLSRTAPDRNSVPPNANKSERRKREARAQRRRWAQSPRSRRAPPIEDGRAEKKHSAHTADDGRHCNVRCARRRRCGGRDGPDRSRRARWRRWLGTRTRRFRGRGGCDARRWRGSGSRGRHGRRISRRGRHRRQRLRANELRVDPHRPVRTFNDSTRAQWAQWGAQCAVLPSPDSPMARSSRVHPPNSKPDARLCDLCDHWQHDPQQQGSRAASRAAASSCLSRRARERTRTRTEKRGQALAARPGAALRVEARLPPSHQNGATGTWQARP